MFMTSCDDSNYYQAPSRSIVHFDGVRIQKTECCLAKGRCLIICAQETLIGRFKSEATRRLSALSLVEGDPPNVAVAQNVYGNVASGSWHV